MSDPSSTDLTTQNDSAPVIQEGPGALLAALVGLAQNPNVNPETVAAWAVIQERMEARDAEREFNAALMRLPPIHVKKNGRIDLTSKEDRQKGLTAQREVPFARWEDMARVIEPLLEAEGFRLAFNSDMRPGDGGGLIVTGTLLHRGGHSRSAKMPLAIDTGPGRNNLQAMGSTLSYGKRYTTEMLLNIVRDADDDDGKLGGTQFITVDQATELLSLMKQAGREEVALLERMTQGEVRSVNDLQQQGYIMVKNTLGQIIAQRANKGQAQ
jgi:hypothetical protein